MIRTLGRPFENNQIPADRVSPVALKLLPLIPSPNRSDPIRNYVNSQPLVENRDEIVLRGDVGFKDSSQLSTRFLMVQGDGVDVRPLPEFGVREIRNRYEASVGYTRTFGEQTVTTWRVEFERDEDLSEAQIARQAGLLKSLGIDGVGISGEEDEGYPSFQLSGYEDFGDEGLPSHEVENSLSLEGGATFSRGDHLIRLEADLGFRQLNDSRSPSLERGAFDLSGVFSGDSFADLLLGRTETATRALGSSRQDLRRTSLQLGVRDEWRLHPRFSITSGLEWSYFGPYRSIRNNVSVFRPLLFEPPTDGGLVDLAKPNQKGGISAVQPDWNNFAPRLGIAYRPLGNSRLVFRASYSISHDPLPSWLFENYMGRNYPYYYIQNSQASAGSGGLELGSPFDTDVATELSIQDISPHIGTPYAQAWTLAVENEFTDQWSLDVSLRSHHSFHEFRFLPSNVPLPGPGPIQPRRPNSDFGEFTIVTGGGSNRFYEAQVDLVRRFSRGFTFSSTLEIRRRFDDDFDEAPSDPRDLAAEWAPSEGFPSKRFRFNFIVDLPFGTGKALGGIPLVDALLGGVRFSGIGRIYSGTPFTVLLPGDHNNDGVFADRPNRVASGSLDGGSRSIDQWFDTSAFVRPGEYEFGNAGRNILVGPPFHNWDLNLVKDFLFSNSHRLQLRIALFNALNHANFDHPGNVFGTRPFGVITAAERAREIEIALKYMF